MWDLGPWGRPFSRGLLKVDAPVVAADTRKVWAWCRDFYLSRMPFGVEWRVKDPTALQSRGSNLRDLVEGIKRVNFSHVLAVLTLLAGGCLPTCSWQLTHSSVWLVGSVGKI